ncbi:hypothetical protein [Labedella endophytica]|uniref:Uncharacterized protein n=1 Tax=Labedella endophytica TaxID=1523160 RepID=A0A433JUF1_9MICO|nr:hypothetical protein [Labedella endophytica]RUR01783.1 hypothetical protein ELQ94_10030 [Labedella endophytica]
MNDLDLSRELTTLVAGIPGVVGVYPAGPLHRAVGLTVVNVAASDDQAPAKVSLVRDKEKGLRVEVAVGVLSTYPVPRTLRTVGDAVRAHLDAMEHDGGLDVRVTASHIETPNPAAPSLTP